MKKMLLSFFLFTNMVVQAQDKDSLVSITDIEEYCMLRVREHWQDVSINVDYGGKIKRDRDNDMRDSLTRKLVKFHSEVDAINYLGKMGWKLVSAFPEVHRGTSTTRYIFKRSRESFPAYIN